MELFASFETEHEILGRRWLQATDAYMSLVWQDLTPAERVHPSVVSAVLLLTQDAQTVQNELLAACQAVALGERAGERVFCLLPHALLRFYRQTGNVAPFLPYLDALRVVYTPNPDACSAWELGAYLDIQKLLSHAGRALPKYESGALISAYHARRFNGAEALYTAENGEVDLMENLLAGYFDFVTDEARETVCRYLSSESFSVSRENRFLLYEALTNLEAYEPLLATLIEAGDPTTAPTETCAFCTTVIEGLLGVDVSYFGKGLYQAVSHMPHGVRYKLLLPYHAGIMVFVEDDETV